MGEIYHPPGNHEETRKRRQAANDQPSPDGDGESIPHETAGKSGTPVCPRLFDACHSACLPAQSVVTPQYSNGLGNFARRSASCPVRPERHPHTASVPVSPPAPRRHPSRALRGAVVEPRCPFATAAPCNLVQCRKRRTVPTSFAYLPYSLPSQTNRAQLRAQPHCAIFSLSLLRLW